MLAGTLVAGALAGCDTESTASTGGAETTPTPARSTRTDPQLKAKVEAIVAEVLGPVPTAAGASGNASLRLAHTIPGNPPVKTPLIPVSFGNAYTGVFDVNAAREATRRLFEAYGIEVRRDVRLQGDGYEFVADGFDTKRGIGFELVDAPTRVRMVDQARVPLAPARTLEPAELAAVGKAVREGKIRMFVADPQDFPTVVGDGYTPMQFYLASVVDYLNWVHGDRDIKLNRVLGQLPPGNRHRRSPGLASLPAGDFEAPGDLDRWTVRGGTIGRTDAWSTHGECGLEVRLEPGGEVVYSIPDGQPVRAPSHFWFSCGVYCPDDLAKGAHLTVVIEAADGTAWRMKAELGKSFVYFTPERSPSASPPTAVRRLVFTTDSERPIRLYIDDVTLGADPTR
jgi:hypothetical protein